MFLVSPGFEFFHSLLEWAVSLGMSCLPAVPAFNVILRALSPTGLLPILEITGMAVLKLTGDLLGILFHSTVIDIVFLLLAILRGIKKHVHSKEQGQQRILIGRIR